MENNKILMVQSVPITIIKQSDTDFISLTDMVRESESGSAVIDNWLRNKNTLEFLSVWEETYNPAFNSLEFEEIKKVAGLNRLTNRQHRLHHCERSVATHAPHSARAKKYMKSACSHAFSISTLEIK